MSGHFSPSCSHLGVTVSQGDTAVHLDLYQVPLDSWHSELSQYMERLAAAMANALHTDDPQANQLNIPVCNVKIFFSIISVLCSGDGLLEAVAAGCGSAS